MFTFSQIGVIFLAIGLMYMLFIGIKLLPNRPTQKLNDRYDVKDYITEIKLEKGHSSIEKRIMDSDCVRELEMDIIEVRRKDDHFTLPAGDFILHEGDVLKVQCNVNKIKELKDKEKVGAKSTIKISRADLKGTETTLVEMVITANSDYVGQTLKDLDFRRRFRTFSVHLYIF